MQVRDGRQSPSAELGSAEGASVRLRMRVRVKRAGLDQQIGAGAPCDASPALALRARQLLQRRTRRDLAANLRRTVEYVDRLGSRPDFSAVMIERHMVRPGREALLGLAERLDGRDPLTPRGVALTVELLTDGCRSPIFNRDCGRSVVQAVWEIADSLGSGAQNVQSSDAFAG